MSRIALVSAMHEELAAVLSRMPDERKVVVAGRDFWLGHWHGHEVVAVLSRIGKVAAATTTTVLIERFGVSRLVFTGVAGGLAPQVRVGDVVVADGFMQHDMDARPLFPLHQIPFEGFSVIEADTDLRHLLSDAARVMLATKRPPGLEHATLFEGLVVSGDQFLSSNEARERVLESLPKASCVDMESAAVAQVCRAADIPLGVMRVISDSADGSAHIDFAKFVEFSASKACAETVRYALRAMAH